MNTDNLKDRNENQDIKLNQSILDESCYNSEMIDNTFFDEIIPLQHEIDFTKLNILKLRRAGFSDISDFKLQEALKSLKEK